ncbi:hypothetical protein C2G38_2216008 [Gigaspora rosea]|uniref:Uncharacterized protein n=1 Tax=Gigaspora rosea TaxID=44941 RepID=A0A397UAZ3_9GLOM|nr:hypothetical protein C2G38_2216008 [Gigaspora rosea]
MNFGTWELEMAKNKNAVDCHGHLHLCLKLNVVRNMEKKYSVSPEISEMKIEINEIKTLMNGMKTEMNEMKTEMNAMNEKMAEISLSLTFLMKLFKLIVNIQTQSDKPKELSEIDLLRQQIIDLETKNSLVKDKLKQAVEKNKTRIIKLKQSNKEIANYNMILRKKKPPNHN